MIIYDLVNCYKHGKVKYVKLYNTGSFHKQLCGFSRGSKKRLIQSVKPVCFENGGVGAWWWEPEKVGSNPFIRCYNCKTISNHGTRQSDSNNFRAQFFTHRHYPIKVDESTCFWNLTQLIVFVRWTTTEIFKKKFSLAHHWRKPQKDKIYAQFVKMVRLQCFELDLDWRSSY